MKSMIKTFAAALALSAPMLANATTLSWSDYNFAFDKHLIDVTDASTTNNSFTWTFDLAGSGFVVGNDIVDGYSVAINLDDNIVCLVVGGPTGCKKHGYDAASETATITIDGSTGSAFEVDPAFLTLGSSSVSLASSLNTLGQLTVTITGVTGNFFYTGSTLDAVGHTVPEPSSIALLAAGLFGISVMRRKQA